MYIDSWKLENHIDSPTIWFADMGIAEVKWNFVQVDFPSCFFDGHKDMTCIFIYLFIIIIIGVVVSKYYFVKSWVFLNDGGSMFIWIE